MTTIVDYQLLLLPWSFAGELLTGFLSLAIVSGVTIAINRLFFSPLAGFPGPKIAALTDWYEFYYDFFRHGKYIFEIEKMHEKYGPIVRVNPRELSIHDPDFYSELYVTGSVRRTENHHNFAEGIGYEGSHFLTVPHDLHRRRRKPLEPFFSRVGVTRLQPMLAEVVGKLERRFEALKGTGTVIRLDHAFHAFSGDVIFQICCEEQATFLEDPEFAPEWFDLIHSIVCSIPLFVQFPVLVKILSLIPEAVLSWAHPGSQGSNNFKKMANKHISDAKRDKLSAKGVEINERTSLFRHILDSDMPESELSSERLSKEAQVILGAGTTSTARTLDLISYYILANKHIRATLNNELKDIMATYPEKTPSWAELENLPYLQALIKEGLRLSYGVMHRLPRCSPDIPIKYRGWTIPCGVPVGMSAYLMHSDPRVYENPHEFCPERWLGATNPRMTRNLVPFSRGSRRCLGMNLAYAEINLALAVLFRPNGPAFDLYETTESDVIQAHDFLIPLPRLDTKGVRIVIH